MLKQTLVGLAVILAVLVPVVIALLIAPWVLILLIVLAGLLVPAYVIGEEILQFKWRYM
jgi:hypothetical protein